MTELEDLRRTLGVLQDREAIRDVITGIARGVDRFDQALLSACIAEDAALDMGAGKTVSGAEFAAMLKPPAQRPRGRMHVVSNERIVLEGDAAWSETYIVSCQAIQDGEGVQTRLRAGRYLDRFERRDGEWKLTQRTFVDEWSRSDSVKAAPPPGAHCSAPAPDDLLYRLFGGEASR